MIQPSSALYGGITTTYPKWRGPSLTSLLRWIVLVCVEATATAGCREPSSTTTPGTTVQTRMADPVPEKSTEPVVLDFGDLHLDRLPDEDYDPAMLPEKVKLLAGSRVRMCGDFYLGTLGDALTEFALVDTDLHNSPIYDLHEQVYVRLRKGHQARAAGRRIAVEGTFTI
jgi:hypothetical protein